MAAAIDGEVTAAVGRWSDGDLNTREDTRRDTDGHEVAAGTREPDEIGMGEIAIEGVHEVRGEGNDVTGNDPFVAFDRLIDVGDEELDA